MASGGTILAAHPAGSSSLAGGADVPEPAAWMLAMAAIVSAFIARQTLNISSRRNSIDSWPMNTYPTGTGQYSLQGGTNFLTVGIHDVPLLSGPPHTTGRQVSHSSRFSS